MFKCIYRTLIVFICATAGYTQTLTISATGQTGTSGTNWSIVGSSLTVSGTAEINVSVLTTQLAAGNLNVQGNTANFILYLNTPLVSSSTNTLTLGLANNTSCVHLNSTLSHAGPLNLLARSVNILENLTLTGGSNLSVTSGTCVIDANVTVGGAVSISASNLFLLGTEFSSAANYNLTATAGFSKTGNGSNYLFSDITTSNAAISITGQVVIGDFNPTVTNNTFNSNGGNISISGAISAFSGTAKTYTALLYGALYNADGAEVSGSTTDIYLRFNTGLQQFIGLPNLTAPYDLTYLVYAGGGGGGNGWGGSFTGGGGGGGGVANGTYSYNGSPFNIMVGSGGAQNTNGTDSYLASIKAGGGGGGGNYNSTAGITGNGGAGYAAGGGGGGSGSNVSGGGASGGTGTQRTGGWGAPCCSGTNYGGAGGGAAGNGSSITIGGAGVSSAITGVSFEYGVGGNIWTTVASRTGQGGGSFGYGTPQGSDGGVIIRFTLPNASTLNAQTPTSAVHFNAGAGGIALGSTVSNLSSLTVTSDGTTSIAGLISGSGSFTKAGTSTLTLSGNHTFSGGTIVNGGILNLNDLSGAGQGVIIGELTVNQNGTVQMSGGVSCLGWHATQRVTKININGGLIDAISGQQHLWNLTGGLNFNGGGTLRSNGGTSSATATSYLEWGVGTITVTNPTSPAVIAGRLNLRSDFTGGAITFNVSDGTADNDLLVSAAITQTSAPTVTKIGAGKITFSGANTHTSVTTISAGILQVGAAGTTGSISGGSVVNNATILFNRTNDYTISNVISGSGTIEKLGSGALTLSGANTFTGVTTISVGTLKLGSTSALGTLAGATIVTTGAALDLNGQAYATAEPLTVSGTGISSGGAVLNSSATAASFAGPITLAAASLVKCTTGNITLSGAINGAFGLDVQGTSADYVQSGIIGATAPLTALSVQTGTGQTTISANTTIAGPVTIDAGQLSISGSHTITPAATNFILRSQKHIINSSATTFTTNGGSVLMAANVDDASDNETLVNGYIYFSSGLTINSNGGHITLGGGDATASGYAMGSSATQFCGLRADGTLNLNSGGGNIVMRGKSYAVYTTAAAWGLGFWTLTTGSINSGAGTILLDGFSQSTAGTYSAGLFSNGALTITSANTTASAIQLIGKGTGTTSDAWGMEFESALNVYATELGGGITFSTSQQVADNYDVVFRGLTNILAKSGPIQLLGKQSGGVGNGRFFFETDDELYLGSKAASPVTTSSSHITVQYDRFSFPAAKLFISTTGTVTFQSASSSFGENFYTSWMSWNQNSQTMAGLTIGKPNSTSHIIHQTNAISAAGPITFYGGDITLSHNLTSSLAGAALLLEATGGISVAANRVLQTNNGNMTLRACATGVASGLSSPIYLNSNSQLLSTGGNIMLGGAYLGAEGNFYCASNISGGGYALRLDAGTIVNAGGGNISLYGKNVTSYGDGVYLNAVNISTTGSGNIGIYGESFGGFNNTTAFSGITFENVASTIQTVNGDLILKALLTSVQSSACSALNFYRSAGSPNQVNHIQLLSQTGDIQITADRGTTTGGGIDHWSWGHVYIGSPANNSYTATGDITLSYSKLSNATNNGFKVKTTGNVVYQPINNSFDVAQSLPPNSFYVLADGASSLTIGKPTNTANITMNEATTSVAGDLTIYAGTLTLNGNLTTTNNGNIRLFTDNPLGGLTTTRTLTAAGTLTYASQGASFAAAVTYPITNLSVSSKGLTIGKVGNDKNIIIGAATSIDGPITLHGASLAISNAITSSNATTGNIALNGTTLTGAAAITLQAGRTLTFNLSSNTTYTGNIVGSGLNVVKDGAGLLALTGSNTPNFATLTINAGTYRLNSNQRLTLTGALTNNGTFTMRDGATFVQASSGTSVSGSGNYNVQKLLSGNSSTWNTTNSGRFWYMGVPMASTTRSDFGTQGATTNRVWSYSEATKQYTEIASPLAALTAGTGYVHRRSSNDTLTFSAAGTNGLYGSDLTLSGLTRTSGASVGFHLISNPYMAYLDWNAVTKTNVEPTFYIRSNNAGVDINSLISYNSSTNQYTNTSGVNITSAEHIRYLAPLQAIWVRVGSSAATGSLAMDRSMLSHQTNNPGLKNSTVFPTLARVNLVDGARFDQMLVFMNQDMTNGVDQYDSEKMFASGVPQLYTMASGKKLVMNGLNSNKKKISVPLYLELPESKVYNLQLAEYQLEDGLILLEDKQEGTIQDFTIHDTYAFYANSGVLQNRFVLHFYQPDATITAQGPSNTWVEGEAPSYTEGGSIQITADAKGKVQISLDQPEAERVVGSVQVTDANGKVVYNGQLEGLITEFALDVPAGIYYLTVVHSSNIFQKKVFIQD